jgi:DNA-binding MarR family transcriptional regulator
MTQILQSYAGLPRHIVKNGVRVTFCCSYDEASVLRVLAQRGPLMVKQIAQALPGINLSKLTRILDSLENQSYITRTLNREDRRSFLVAPTEQGMQLLETFIRKLEGLGQGMLKALTATERLVLVELFAKIQANWDDLTSPEDEKTAR